MWYYIDIIHPPSLSLYACRKRAKNKSVYCFFKFLFDNWPLQDALVVFGLSVWEICMFLVNLVSPIDTTFNYRLAHADVTKWEVVRRPLTCCIESVGVCQCVCCSPRRGTHYGFREHLSTRCYKKLVGPKQRKQYIRNASMKLRNDTAVGWKYWGNRFCEFSSYVFWTHYYIFRSGL